MNSTSPPLPEALLNFDLAANRRCFRANVPSAKDYDSRLEELTQLQQRMLATLVQCFFESTRPGAWVASEEVASVVGKSPSVVGRFFGSVEFNSVTRGRFNFSRVACLPMENNFLVEGCFVDHCTSLWRPTLECLALHASGRLNTDKPMPNID